MAVKAFTTANVLSRLLVQPKFNAQELLALGSTCRALYTATIGNKQVWQDYLDIRFPTNAFCMHRLLEPYIALQFDSSSVPGGTSFSFQAYFWYLTAQTTYPSVTEDADSSIAALEHPLSNNMVSLLITSPPFDSLALDDLISQAHAHLQSFQLSGGNADELIAAGLNLLQAAYIYPFHPAIYHLLAVIAYICHANEEALKIVEMAVAIDEDFTEALELRNELLANIASDTIVENNNSLQPLQPHSKNDESPTIRLLSSLSPPKLAMNVRSALTDIFAQFDADNDGTWSPQELGEYVKYMNDIQPTADFLRQFAIMFGCNAIGNLVLNGFLNFYTQQSVNEPEETLRDLEKLNIHL